ncbi:MAG: carotenoid biosynthesis protein [Armatimonadota bacterium]
MVLNALSGIAIIVGSWLLFDSGVKLPPWNYDQLAYGLGLASTGLGILVAFGHMMLAQGARATVMLMGLCIVIAGGAELLSTTTGFPFGHYAYTHRLGPKFLDQVPYVIPLSWFMMLYPALHIAHHMGLARPVRPMAAASILTLWDVAMDPAVTTGFAYWVWYSPGDFYGMPWYNWAGWLAVGWIVCELFERSHPHWRPSASAIPLTLWLVQGGMMAGLAWVLDRPIAAWLWIVGAIVVVVGYAHVPKLIGRRAHGAGS